MSRMTACFMAVAMTAIAGTALAQSMPTSQPNLLQIFREEVKVGHAADHSKVEAGWPAAFEKAKDPYTYIALVAMTGRGEAWFVVPFASNAAIADSLKREDEPTLAASLQRLSRADAEDVSAVDSILAMARKDLSHGAFPDTAKQRFYDVMIFTVRPGHERDFEAAAKAYGAAADRSAPQASYRVYQVLAGMPSPTFLIFSSVTNYADYDKSMAEDAAIMKGATEAERDTLENFAKDGLVSSEAIRFRLDPAMSYVTQEVRAEDPAFWMPKPVSVMATAKPMPKPTEKR